jgi:hypothetical protein
MGWSITESLLLVLTIQMSILVYSLRKHSSLMPKQSTDQIYYDNRIELELILIRHHLMLDIDSETKDQFIRGVCKERIDIRLKT